MSDTGAQTKCCFDANVWIDLFRRTYRRKTFVTLWQKVEQGVSVGDILTVDAVVHELGEHDDELWRWLKQQRDQTKGFVLVSDPGIQRQAGELVRKYAVKADADPFIAAAAQVRGLVVVSGERRLDYPREKPPRLPNLCDLLGVHCIGLLELFEERKWTF